MKSRTSDQERPTAIVDDGADNRRKRKRLLPAALLAGGACGLIAAPTSAVQLGQLEVHSSLGQPLRASIAYALTPNEQLGSYCIFLNPQRSADGLPTLSRAQLTVANGRIDIRGSTPVREPILTLGLTVDCPYTANLTRSYLLMLDPQEPAQAATPSQPRYGAAVNRAPVRSSSGSQQAAIDDAPIAATGTYRVQRGDSLSMIAARIEDRPVGLWQAVNALFAANPDAFVNGDMNLLKAGSLLTIPSFDGATIPTDSNVTETSAADAEPATGAAYPGIAREAAATGEATVDAARDAAVDGPTGTASELDALAVPADITSEAASATDAAADQTQDLRPGDVLVGTDRPVVSPVDTTDDVAPGADTVADGATVAPALDDGPRPLFYWLGGTGVALILGLLLFGRRLKGRRSPVSAQVPAEPATEDDAPTARNRAVPAVDFEIGDEAVTEKSLDADLSAGTGLKFGTDIEVAEDFGFSTSRDLGTDLDLLIPEGAESEEPSTDILPPQRAEDTILEREILPTDDDEYDLSMVVDATRQSFDDGDITAKDLEAVPVATDTDDEVGDEYTLSNEVDYKVLEQDYEDELSATQALNAEIAKAAIALADRLDATEELSGIADDDEITAEQTARMQTENGDEEEELSDLDDTGINEELPIEIPDDGDDTAESTFEGTIEMNGEIRKHDFTEDTGATTELTAELAPAENDSTVEMDVESGHVNTKKSVG